MKLNITALNLFTDRKNLEIYVKEAEEAYYAGSFSKISDICSEADIKWYQNIMKLLSDLEDAYEYLESTGLFESSSK